jgi:hypothetical protein
VSSGSVKLYPYPTWKVLATAVAPGGKFLTVSSNPDGIVVIHPTTGSVFWPLPQSASCSPLVVSGHVYVSCGSTTQSCVLQRPLAGSANLSFSQVGPTFPVSLLPHDLAVSTNDNAVWIALQGSPSRIERIVAGRRSGPTAPVPPPVVITLPKGWYPVYLTQGEPGWFYVVARTGSPGSSTSILARVPMTPGGMSMKLASLPAGLPGRVLRASDGSAWVTGTNGDAGWLAHYKPASGATEVFKDSQRRYGSIAEGIAGRMFFVRTAETDPWTSDILMFKLSPVGGVGPVTKIPGAVHAFRMLPDGQGKFWFGTMKETHDPDNKYAYGVGHFTPPDCDPLVDC